MVFKVESITLILTGCALFLVQSSTSTLTENVKSVELRERIDALQMMMEALQAENKMLTTTLGNLKTENDELRTDVRELKTHVFDQDEEIRAFKIQIANLESILPSKWTSNNAEEFDDSASRNEGPSSRALGRPPSSCQEWWISSPVKLADGIYLIKNNETKKIEAIFCLFQDGNPISQEFIGNADVKTKSVHFYATRNSSFSSGAVIPFELARLNEGGAMNLVSGIFTAPVPGIYHFDFSGVQASYSNSLFIKLQVNGADIGADYTYQSSTGTVYTFSLSASLRLAEGDRVNLYNLSGGILYDDSYHQTHFSGWLVEEDL